MSNGHIKPLEKDILELEQSFSGFRQVLSKQDQEIFDQLFDGARKQAFAIRLAEHALPFEAIIFTMVINQAREIERLKGMVGVDRGW